MAKYGHTIRWDQIVDKCRDRLYFKYQNRRFKVEKKQFLDLLNRILNWATTAKTVFSRNQSSRRGGYGRSEFFTDLNLLVGLRLFNEILVIKLVRVTAIYLVF